MGHPHPRLRARRRQAENATESEAFGPHAAELRRAEATHHNVDVLLPRLVAARGFIDADDIAAVLHYRVERATARPAGSGGLASQHDSSPASSRKRTASSTPRCERLSTSERN